jgi:hypothetical protein
MRESVYFKACFFIIAIVLWIFLVGPLCISSRTEFIIAYFVATILVIPTVYRIGKDIVDEISKMFPDH